MFLRKMIIKESGNDRKMDDSKPIRFYFSQGVEGRKADIIDKLVTRAK